MEEKMPGKECKKERDEREKLHRELMNSYEDDQKKSPPEDYKALPVYKTKFPIGIILENEN
ncbi:MAG: hypothetical protein ACI9S8_000978 [Chlamydiales bacterium]|jgi:hypothetical protein